MNWKLLRRALVQSLWMAIVICGLVFGAAYHDWIVVENSEAGRRTLHELLIPFPTFVFLLLTFFWCAIFKREEWSS